MNAENPTPPVVEKDARNRAWRTFVQGLGIDVAVAATLTLAPLVSSIEWTPAFWIAVGLSVARSVVQAVVSYVARKVVPPPAELDAR